MIYYFADTFHGTKCILYTKKALLMECLIYLASSHENTPHRDGIFPRFHPACFPCKNLFILTITESPDCIKVTPRWFSDCFFIKILPAYESLSGMCLQLTVLFNVFSICSHSTSNFFLCQAVNQIKSTSLQVT